MIKPVVVDLEVDTTLGDVTVSFIHKKDQVFLSHICSFFEKSQKIVCDLRTLAQFQGSEMPLGLLQDFIEGYIKFLRLHPLLFQLWFPIKGTPTQQGPYQWL